MNFRWTHPHCSSWPYAHSHVTPGQSRQQVTRRTFHFIRPWIVFSFHLLSKKLAQFFLKNFFLLKWVSLCWPRCSWSPASASQVVETTVTCGTKLAVTEFKTGQTYTLHNSSSVISTTHLHYPVSSHSPGNQPPPQGLATSQLAYAEHLMHSFPVNTTTPWLLSCLSSFTWYTILFFLKLYLFHVQEWFACMHVCIKSVYSVPEN